MTRFSLFCCFLLGPDEMLRLAPFMLDMVTLEAVVLASFKAANCLSSFLFSPSSVAFPPVVPDEAKSSSASITTAPTQVKVEAVESSILGMEDIV